MSAFRTIIEETARSQRTIILRVAAFTSDPRFRPRLNLTPGNDIELSGAPRRQMLQHPGVWVADHPLPLDIPLTRSLTLIFSPCVGARIRVAEDTPPGIPVYAKIGGVLLIALACAFNLNPLLAATLAVIGEMYLRRSLD